MARGRDDFADAYVDEKISISEYSLSASVACGKVRFSFLVVGSTDYLSIFFSFVVRWKNSGTLSDEQHPSPIFLPIFDILTFIWLIFLYVTPKWALFFLTKKRSPVHRQNLHFNSQKKRSVENAWHLFRLFLYLLNLNSHRTPLFFFTIDRFAELCMFMYHPHLSTPHLYLHLPHPSPPCDSTRICIGKII